MRVYRSYAPASLKCNLQIKKLKAENFKNLKTAKKKRRKDQMQNNKREKKREL